MSNRPQVKQRWVLGWAARCGESWRDQVNSHLWLSCNFWKRSGKDWKTWKIMWKKHMANFFCLSGKNVLKPSILTYYFWKSHLHCSSCQNHCWASSCYKCGESFFTSDWSKFSATFGSCAVFSSRCNIWMITTFAYLQHVWCVDAVWGMSQ